MKCLCGSESCSIGDISVTEYMFECESCGLKIIHQDKSVLESFVADKKVIKVISAEKLIESLNNFCIELVDQLSDTPIHSAYSLGQIAFIEQLIKSVKRQGD